jgi:hypothetical protein
MFKNANSISTVLHHLEANTLRTIKSAEFVEQTRLRFVLFIVTAATLLCLYCMNIYRAPPLLFDVQQTFLFIFFN